MREVTQLNAVEVTVDPAASAKMVRPRRPRGSRNPALVLLTMTSVCGMFAVLAIPAYALNPVETKSDSLAAVSAQSLSVAADASAASSARDGFTATTPEELAQAREAAEAALIAASYVYVYRDPGPRQAGDDYPYRGQSGLSPLRYYAGECVDFVAWRLNRDIGATDKWNWGTLTPGGGSASQWTSAWYDHGWPVSDIPVAGAVAVTEYDHVAYVKQVNDDGSVLIEEYNYVGYHEYGTRTISAGSATYLYPPG